jgi:hypothetical protein
VAIEESWQCSHAWWKEPHWPHTSRTTPATIGDLLRNQHKPSPSKNVNWWVFFRVGCSRTSKSLLKFDDNLKEYCKSSTLCPQQDLCSDTILRQICCGETVSLIHMIMYFYEKSVQIYSEICPEPRAQLLIRKMVRTRSRILSTVYFLYKVWKFGKDLGW